MNRIYLQSACFTKGVDGVVGYARVRTCEVEEGDVRNAQQIQWT